MVEASYSGPDDYREVQIVNNTDQAPKPVTGWLSLEAQSMMMAMLVSALLVIVISLSAAWLVSTAEELGPRKRRHLWRLKSGLSPIGATYDSASSSSDSSDDEDSSNQRSEEDTDSSEEEKSADEETSNATEKTNSSDEGEDEYASEDYQAIDISSEDSDELRSEPEIPMKPTTKATTTETGLEREAYLKRNHGGHPRFVVRAGRSITFRWVRERRRQYNRL